jgi:pseudaminic acid cytidylyltransferase
MAYSIQAARESGVFERIIVSTDDPKIAELAEDYGAEIPFLREAKLADDMTPVSAATVDALERLDPAGEMFGCVCQLMPNCPLRTARDVADSYKQFLETGAESQISVVRYGWQNPWWAMRRNEKFQLEPIFGEYMTSRSQDLPKVFCPTGAVWWARNEVLRRQGTYHVPNRTGWEIPWQRGVDIDTEDDWAMAETLYGLGSSIKATQSDVRR